jgi:putative ABC transport system ATP-binding protein
LFSLEQTIGAQPTPVSLPCADRSDAPLIQLRDVVKVYHTAGGDLTALKGINADLYQGEFVGIIGKSGAGKSTLVNVITGVDRLTSGQVRVGDVLVHQLNENQMALWRGRNVGVVYQSFELLPTLSLLDNVMLPMDFCGLYKPRKSLERARQLLTQVGLEEHMRKPPTRISGGQQQRVAIARALANDPPILVADEPTGNLDSFTAEGILQLFETLAEQGKTIVMVTHDESLAQRFSCVLRIADGEMKENVKREA